MDTRPSWQQYFMEMAFLVARRSTCLRRKVGTVLVRDNQILSTGYNGSPKGIAHCSETGCLRAQRMFPPAAIMNSAEVCMPNKMPSSKPANGSSTRGATLYCTNQPCSICARLIINAEIKTVYVASTYPDALAEQLLKEAGIEVHLYDIETDKLERLI